MKRSLARLFVLAGSVLALDWWTKRWATEHLAYRPPLDLLGEFVRLTYTRNSGVAFGLGAGVRFPYYVFSIAAAIIILTMFLRRRAQGLPRKVALALILGGALGNLVDRLASGAVVDFIEIGWGRWHWPVFSVADSAVTIGVVLFALTWPRAGEAETAPDATAAPDSVTGPPLATGAHSDEPTPGSPGPGVRRGGAAGSLSGGGAEEPLA